MPLTGRAQRVGVTGAPGVGKSTFIEAMGTRLVAEGHRVAVLAVDPSSEVTGGSILGDKTRMEDLSRNADAFVRPSPSSDAGGGVAPRTREAMLLCEAAGFDVVLVETVGVGQSEFAVAHMVDTFALLLLPGAGDELQGIKRGVVELADVIVVHKADGDQQGQAEQARADYAAAQTVVQRGAAGWQPPVLSCSSRTGDGLDSVWQAVQAHRAALGEGGLAEKRRDQALHWFDEAVAASLRRDLLADPGAAAALPGLRQRVHDGVLQPSAAAAELLSSRTGP